MGKVEEELSRKDGVDAADPDAEALRAKLGEGFVSVRAHRGQVTAEVSPSALREAARLLLEVRGFSLLSHVSGVDCLELPAPRRFKVVYDLLDLGRAKRFRLEVFCEDDLAPAVPSVGDIWPAALAHECEAYDMVGIRFEGHPALERILTPEGFEGYPHRKDFDIGREPVEFTFRETPLGKPAAKD
ncbi:MAG: NADH-quinone oxidoreductase subunit C [bacterium]|nr:NADH-quinone oxidoreductase subunit C [bacterium]